MTIDVLKGIVRVVLVCWIVGLMPALWADIVIEVRTPMSPPE